MKGIERARRWWRRGTAPFRSSIVILAYHRVFATASDPQRLCVNPANFEKHLEILQRFCTVLSLKDLLVAREKGCLEKRGAIMTFDDGYADNLWNAKPLLERFAVPATVFVTTGYIGQEKEFWWDELESLILVSPLLPTRLELRLNGRIYEWALGKGWQTSSQSNNAHRQWHVGMNDDPTPRHRIYRELHQLLRPLAGEDRESLLAMLRSQIRDSAVSRPLYRALTRDEICQLAEGGLVEVGAHAVTHPVLSSQTAEIQRWEIKESKKMLEAILGQEITAFSYPYGSISDGGKEAIHLVQEAGFKSACTNTPGIVTLSSHPFWLPRFLIRDWDGEGFKRQLSLFFGS